MYAGYSAQQIFILFSCRFVISPPECYEMIGTDQWNDKAIRVESLRNTDLLVYAVNRDEWSADA